MTYSIANAAAALLLLVLAVVGDGAAATPIGLNGSNTGNSCNKHGGDTAAVIACNVFAASLVRTRTKTSDTLRRTTSTP